MLGKETLLSSSIAGVRRGRLVPARCGEDAQRPAMGIDTGIDALMVSRGDPAQALRIANLGLLASLDVRTAAFEANARRFEAEWNEPRASMVVSGQENQIEGRAGRQVDDCPASHCSRPLAAIVRQGTLHCRHSPGRVRCATRGLCVSFCDSPKVRLQWPHWMRR
jgi:hypothetical protein